MASRGPEEAANDYCTDIRRMFVCVTKTLGSLLNIAEQESFTLPHTLYTEEPIRLETAVYPERKITLEISHTYKIQQDQSSGELQPVVVSYAYTFHHEKRHGEQSDTPFLAYHWHPEVAQKEFPHLYLKAGAEVGMAKLREAHIPTGFVELPWLIAFAIKELDVNPRKQDWQQRFGAAPDSIVPARTVGNPE